MGGIRSALLIAAFAAFLIAPAAAEPRPCGEEAPCAVEGGEYYLAFPDNWDGATPLPALLFFHAHRSSGLSTIRSRTLKRAFADHGYLIIAPNGVERPRDNVRGWPGRPQFDGRRDDLAFTNAVIEDVMRRVPLKRERILVSGFSAGGSMAWMLACYEGGKFAAFAPVAGALRRPVPRDGCSGGPAPVYHFHGFADTIVPLEGRGIRDWHQGDVFETLSLMRDADRCDSRPTATEIGEVYRCRVWQGCGSGKEIRFCLHDGGHTLPAGWAERVRDWFEREIGGS